MTLATPELPNGYFFRVTYAHFGLVYVQLRKHTWYGSKNIGQVRTEASNAEVRYGMDYLKDIHDKREAVKTALPNLLGDYPPKTLEHQ